MDNQNQNAFLKDLLENHIVPLVTKFDRAASTQGPTLPAHQAQLTESLQHLLKMLKKQLPEDKYKEAYDLILSLERSYIYQLQTKEQACNLNRLGLEGLSSIADHIGNKISRA